MASVDDYIDPLMEQVQREAVQRTELSEQEIEAIYDPAGDNTITAEQTQNFLAFQTAQQSIINEAIQPMYEALLAGEPEIWG